MTRARYLARNAVAALTAIVLVGVPAIAQRPDAQYALVWQGVTRHYIVHTPAHVESGRPLPLIVVLHGTGGNGAEALRMGHWAALSDAKNVLVVAPDAEAADLERSPGRGNLTSWNDGSGREPWTSRGVDDVGFIGAVIDEVARHYHVACTRVYVTGFSNGASMTWRLGAESGQRLAAIAPVAGVLWHVPRTLPHPLPAMYIVGTADPLNPMAGGRTPSFSSEGGDVLRPPALASVAAWARLLRCDTTSTHVMHTQHVEVRTYVGCQAGLRAELVDGLGHHWPGGRDALPAALVGPRSNSLDATQAIWDFFDRHTLWLPQ